MPRSPLRMRLGETLGLFTVVKIVAAEDEVRTGVVLDGDVGGSEGDMVVLLGLFQGL